MRAFASQYRIYCRAFALLPSFFFHISVFHLWVPLHWAVQHLTAFGAFSIISGVSFVLVFYSVGGLDPTFGVQIKSTILSHAYYSLALSRSRLSTSRKGRDTITQRQMGIVTSTSMQEGLEEKKKRKWYTTSIMVRRCLNRNWKKYKD